VTLWLLRIIISSIIIITIISCADLLSASGGNVCRNGVITSVRSQRHAGRRQWLVTSLSLHRIAGAAVLHHERAMQFHADLSRRRRSSDCTRHNTPEQSRAQWLVDGRRQSRRGWARPIESDSGTRSSETPASDAADAAAADGRWLAPRRRRPSVKDAVDDARQAPS